MYGKLIISSLALLIASQSAFAAGGGGVVLGATRVVYDASSKEASLSINNKNADQYFLVQSWIDDANGNKKVPFAITPPLFRLNAEKENMMRIMKTAGELPGDRESVFYVNVKAIPPVPDNADTQNTLQLAIKTRIKLFYRPKGLQGKAAEAGSHLQWSQQGKDLVVKNPTAYAVSFNEINVSGKPVKDINMVLPKSESHYAMPAGAGKNVSFTFINDFGGVSEPINAVAN
ncbi:fimbria/pilus periplasmic chaperone [Enterobacteriaceae bacterium Kacie_13]|nr:fimbria/pilus periplasmic chaperone [Enterobacteriaceae bacterium Kacie_13]